MTSTALELGAPGRDDVFGYGGLVQATTAMNNFLGGAGNGTMNVTATTNY
ncbi:MAG: hypothetical protein ACWGOY_04115 [Anaerolineales bacterium]